MLGILKRQAVNEGRKTLQIIYVLPCLHFSVKSGSNSCVSCKTAVRLSAAY